MLRGLREAYLHLYDTIEEFMSREEFERLLAARGFTVRRAEDWTGGIVSLIVATPS